MNNAFAICTALFYALPLLVIVTLFHYTALRFLNSSHLSNSRSVHNVSIAIHIIATRFLVKAYQSIPFSVPPLFQVMPCLCISLTFDAFAFPFLTIQSLCWSFSASRFLCFASLLNVTAELNNSCTMPCISLSNLRYTIPLLKSTLLFRCYSFRFLAAPSLVLSIGALHSISNAEPTDATAQLFYSLP